MENRFKPGRTLWLALLLVATSVSMAAQMNSKAGHITIIAIMPENLSLSVNSNGAAYSGPAAGRPEIPGAVATGITMGWSLMQGRAKVATFATVDRTNIPIIIAGASAHVSPFPDERGSQPHGFRIHSKVSHTQLSGSNLTDMNRRGASTAALPDLEDPSRRRQLQDDTPVGTLKIQVQPVL
ncbi:MAG TPA: hypothetical protein VI685_26200 [Candidatus Angelobacter sp.]